jgi:hypothetical protein
MKDVRHAVVVMNAAHLLLPSQMAILNEEFDSWGLFPVPEEGWDLARQLEVVEELLTAKYIVFVSVIPIVFGKVLTMSSRQAFPSVRVFYKEVPDGKEGWQLVSI